VKAIVFERFDLSLIVASDDHAKTGILYGGVSMAAGVFVPLFDDAFTVKERTVRINADFSLSKPSIGLNALVFVRPERMILIGIMLLAYLPVQYKKRNKEKAVSVL